MKVNLFILRWINCVVGLFLIGFAFKLLIGNGNSFTTILYGIIALLLELNSEALQKK